MFIDKDGKLRKPVVYLADFEMFLPTCPETVAYWKKTCEKYGLIGLFPGDGSPVKEGPNFWQRIFEHDVNYMKESDMCIAQLDDWRGHEADSGTAFELGYFIAKGMPAYGFYTGKKPLIARNIKRSDEDPAYDENGYLIEDKEFAFENMFSLVYIGDSFEDACKRARADFDRQLIEAGYVPFEITETL